MVTARQRETNSPDDHRFRLLVESVKDYGIFMLSPTGHIETWNAGAARLKGYTPHEIIGKHFSVFYPKVDVEAGKCEMELEGAAREGRFEDEGWRVRKDGTLFWANVIITALRDESNELVGFAKVTRDLSERRAAEEEAHRFQLLVESVKDYGIFVLGADGRVATWNLGAERLQGYSANEILGKHFSIFYPPADVAAGKCERELEAAAREGRVMDDGWRLRKDGTRFWANVTITALRDKNSQLVGYAKVTRDMSERQAAEEQGRRFRLLIESVKDYGIFILNPRGFVDTWNPGAERLNGFTTPEIVGKHFSIFYPREDIVAGKCEMELENAERVGRFEDEGWRLRKDGTRFWANVVITALKDELGNLVGFAKVTRDLTERVEAEQRFRQLAAERAALAEKARQQEFHERFVAILGHDLRNPLSSIDMAAGLLLQQGMDEPSRRVVERMSRSTQRMTRMIEQILDLTRARLATGFDIARAPLDLAAVVKLVADEIATAHPTRKLHVHVPPIIGEWDQDRLAQVFSNLLGNAVNHGDPRKPISVHGRSEDDLVIVDVHNDGPVIPHEVRSVLFEPFRRGPRHSRTSATAGLGLGLHISREILRAHGGEITVRSDDSGTTFRVTLPRRAPTTIMLGEGESTR